MSFINFVVALVVFAFLLIKRGIVIVPQGYEYTVENFGRFSTILKPGLHFLIPIVERISRKVNMMEQSLDIPQQEAQTKDGKTVWLGGVITFQVTDSYQVTYKTNDLSNDILKYITKRFKVIIGDINANDILSKKRVINEKLFRYCSYDMVPWGVKVIQIEVTDIVLDPLDKKHQNK